MFGKRSATAVQTAVPAAGPALRETAPAPTVPVLAEPEIVQRRIEVGELGAPALHLVPRLAPTPRSIKLLALRHHERERIPDGRRVAVQGPGEERLSTSAGQPSTGCSRNSHGRYV